jgi:nucleoside-triphosphatase THEP1
MSTEQQAIVSNIKHSHVQVSACAGSGKTTTCKYIASTYPNKNILLFSYNTRLRYETKAKLKEFTNVDVHTFHSFCRTYYSDDCIDDAGITNVINKNISMYSHAKKRQPDIIILDECQDLRSILHKFIKKVIYDCNIQDSVHLCILGDERQSIYEYDGADTRYLTFASYIYLTNSDIMWEKNKLSHTYRVPKNICDFVNVCMLKEQKLTPVVDHKYKPRYIVCDTYKSNKPFEEVKMYIDAGYKPDDIFILAYSVKGGTPISKLENKIIAKLKAPVFVPSGDDERINNDIIAGKIVFTTFHQSKGLERKVVIIFGFDDSFFHYFKSDSNPNICPNELYVACTRSCERLSLFHHTSRNELPFLSSNYKMYVDYINENIPLLLLEDRPRAPRKFNVTQLVQKLKSDILDKIVNKHIVVRRRKTILNKKHLYLPPVLNVKKYGIDLKENISDINGSLIPMYYELISCKSIQLYDNIRTIVTSPTTTPFDPDRSTLINLCASVGLYDLMKKCASCDILTLDFNKRLQVIIQLIIVNAAYGTGFNFKTKQINRFNWLSESVVEECVERIKKLHLGKDLRFELKISTSIIDQKTNQELFLSGAIDMIDYENKTIYEFKCIKGNLKNSHLLQLGLYLYLFNDPEYTYKIVNIVTSERITITIDDINQFIQDILTEVNKDNSFHKLNDQEFIDENAY